MIEQNTPGRLAINLMEDYPDASIGDFIMAIAQMIKRDRERYAAEPNVNPLVLTCIDGALGHLADADLAYYASFK